MTKFTFILAWILPLATLAAAPRENLGFDPEKNLDDVSAVYFAPENSILFRMRNPDGSYREFQRTFERPNDLWGMHGWRGKIKGDRVTIKSGSPIAGAPVQYVFQQGRLVSFTYKGVKHDYAYGSPRPLTAGGMPCVFADEMELVAKRHAKASKNKEEGKGTKKKPVLVKVRGQVERELLKKWAKSGRLRVPFNNPNENGFLYMTIALCASFLFFFRRRAVKITGAVLFVAACGALVMTASRGSFLAFALGLAPVIALKFRTVLRSKGVWVLAGVVLVGAIGWFSFHESRLLTRGFTETSRWSNQMRLELWSTAPKMMADAPNGWGRMHVGRAQMDWYQPLDELALNGSLVNEHLTKLVGLGRLGRFGYLFGWLAALGLLGFTAWRTRNAVAFGLLAAIGVAGWFNPVFDNRLLWVVPVIGLVLFLVFRPWKVWRPRPLLIILGASVVLALAVQIGVTAWGGTQPDVRGYPIRVEPNRVYVKGLKPQTWIVDDGSMLGGVFACKDIRGYYAYNPKAPSVGYVRRVRDLPEGKIHCLVLAGKAGGGWLKAFGSRIERERWREADVKAHLPDELVFITPDFAPSALPPPYLENCKSRLIIGEFAAQYESEYAEPPEWVKIVPGAELYLNGWMEYGLGLR